LETSKPSTVNTWAPSTKPVAGTGLQPQLEQQSWADALCGYLGKVGAIVAKDLAAELRTKEILTSMLVFAFLVVVIFNFSFELRNVDMAALGPGILWVSFTFAGILGLNRAFALEKDRGCLEGLMLTPVDRSAIYLGKVTGTFLFMVVMEAVALPIFGILNDVPVFKPALVPVILLGTLGFVAVGIPFAAMAANTRTREVMLPILLFPMVVPVIIASVKATGAVLADQPLSTVSEWLTLLVAYDVIFLVICFLTFELVLEE
jgi:heme exporter protein B